MDLGRWLLNGYNSGSSWIEFTYNGMILVEMVLVTIRISIDSGLMVVHAGLMVIHKGSLVVHKS